MGIEARGSAIGVCRIGGPPSIYLADIHPVDEVRPRTLTHPLTLQDRLIRLQCVYVLSSMRIASHSSLSPPIVVMPRRRSRRNRKRVGPSGLVKMSAVISSVLRYRSSI